MRYCRCSITESPRARCFWLWANCMTVLIVDLIGDYGGLHKPMPRFAAFLCLFSVAAFGLPGAANFIGEFLVLVGTSYRSFVMVLLAMGGIVLAAAYML